MKTRPPRVTPLTLKSKDALALSALLMKPRNARACFVFAHGAGAGMTHPFMEDLAAKLYGHGIATLRFQFPFMAKGSKRPDTPAVAHAAIRLAAAEARRRCRGRLIIAGGKSFGGRMTSQAQAEEPIEGIYALAFVGFPLHPAGKSSIIRAEHLAGIRIPMLFIQGTRDKLAEPALLRQVCKGLRSRATSLLIDGADHGFHIPVRSGRTDQDVVAEIALAISQWVERLKS
jgi:predicted alpha/beta-hydrolase family hydrolase